MSVHITATIARNQLNEKFDKAIQIGDLLLAGDVASEMGEIDEVESDRMFDLIDKEGKRLSDMVQENNYHTLFHVKDGELDEYPRDYYDKDLED